MTGSIPPCPRAGQDPAFANVSYASLAVFTGVGMSITAFPVLARILTETGLIAVPIGEGAGWGPLSEYLQSWQRTLTDLSPCLSWASLALLVSPSTGKMTLSAAAFNDAVAW